MKRILAAFVATAISLAGFAALLATISWFMHSASFWGIFNHPRFWLMMGSTTSILICVVLVPFLDMKQQRERRAREIDQSGALKPAPRLWMRYFQPTDE